MVSYVNDKAKEKFLSAGLNLSTLNLKCVLVDKADYTPSAAHDFLDDIPAAGRVATSGNLTTKSVLNGIFDADDITYSSVTGDPSEGLQIYNDTGSAATSDLIAWLDEAEVTGLPVTPNGGDITVTFDAGANKIFAL